LAAIRSTYFRGVVDLGVLVVPLLMPLAGLSCERAFAQETSIRLADWKQQPDSSEDEPRPRHMVRLFGAQNNPRKPWAVILCKFSDLPDFEPYPVSFYRDRFTEVGDGKGTELNGTNLRR
jgi:hypothetical protein